MQPIHTQPPRQVSRRGFLGLLGFLGAATATGISLSTSNGTETLPLTSAKPEESNRLNLAQLRSLFPGGKPDSLVPNYRLVRGALTEQKLADPQMLSYAMATIRMETGTFEPISERGKDAYFLQYEQGRKAEILGNIKSGDGKRFRGRGFVQITGRDNYTRYSKRLGYGDLLVRQPERANHPEVAAKIFTLYLKDHEDKIRRALNSNDLGKYMRARHAVNPGERSPAKIILFTKVYKIAFKMFKR